MSIRFGHKALQSFPCEGSQYERQRAMRQSFLNFCSENKRLDLLGQWDVDANLPLTPEAVAPNSNRSVRWLCEKGHEYKAAVVSRTAVGSGCPYCANRKVLAGFNDLATIEPQLAKEWHPTLNGDLTPRDVTCGTARRVWWRCKMGHEWRASVARRTSGCGCPVCAGKSVLIGENDLKTSYPAIAAQWHPTKNGALTPEAVTPSSNRGVWWQCEKGHEYKASIASRTAHGSGCPYCANRRVLAGYNDLATKEPQLAKQWHPTLNEALTPRDVTCGSTHKVWWRCDVCGFEWKALIYSRAGVQKTGCPACAGRVKERELLRYDRVLSESR